MDESGKMDRPDLEALARAMLESFTVGRGGVRQDWEQLAPEQRAGWRAVADLAVMFAYVRRHERPTHHAADAAEVLEKLERTLREMGPTASVSAGFEPKFGGAFHVALSDGIGKRGALETSLAAALRVVLR